MRGDSVRHKKGLIIGLAAALAAALVCAVLWSCGVLGGREMTVGKRVALKDITEFYYTEAASTNPPSYQRYRFYLSDGKYLFYHEKREGDHFPLREADVTVSGTVELSEEQWAEFLACVDGGSVQKRTESTDSGSSGPWLYLYWKGDRSRYQEFSFASTAQQAAFLALCHILSTAA